MLIRAACRSGGDGLTRAWQCGHREGHPATLGGAVGRGITESRPGQVPELVLLMSTGEEAGNLDAMLRKSDFCDPQSKPRCRHLLAEPAIVLVGAPWSV
jgi:hypothetical protein